MSWWRRLAAAGGNPRQRTLRLAALVVVILLVGSIAWAWSGVTSPSRSTPGSSSDGTAAGEPGAANGPDDGTGDAPGTTGDAADPGSPGDDKDGSASPAPTETSQPATRRKPQKVKLDETGRPRKGLTAEIARIEAVTGSAQIPGEVSGPALRLTVRVANSGDDPISIYSTVANFYYGKDRTPATPMLKPGARRFPSQVPAGGKATGVLVFSVPKDRRDRLVLELNLDNEFRTIEFSGGCPELC